MFSKKSILLTMAILMVFSCLVFSISYAADAPTESAEEGMQFYLKFSLIENEEHPSAAGARAFKEKIEELSGGQIQVELFFNSTLFTQAGTLPALTSGQLDISYLSKQLTATLMPDMEMFASTYMFKNYEHMRAVMDSDIGKELAQRIEDKAGYIPLDFHYSGNRNINSRTEDPIMTPEDMADIILRMPDSPTWIQAGESLGAKVTPLAYAEVYTALQTGTIDAQDNPVTGTYTSKFYEVTKQYSLTGHLVDFAMLGLSKKVWDKMTEQQQEWVREAGLYCEEAFDAAVLKMEAEMIDFFEGEGLTIVHPDIDAFREHSYNYYVSNGLTSNWNMELYNQIQAMADQY